MKTHLPVPERTLPPPSAERIRAAIMVGRLDDRPRPSTSWRRPLAAALVVIALMATAVILWPRAARTEVAATPSVEVTRALTPADQRPRPVTPSAPPEVSPADPTTGPTSPLDVFRTDRGPMSPQDEAVAATFCAGEPGRTRGGVVSPYARWVSDGQRNLPVVVVQISGGWEWSCVGDSLDGQLDSRDPAEAGPTTRYPVIMRHASPEVAEKGLASEFDYLALAGVARVQVRAVVRGEPQPWFEAEVHGRRAFLPMFNPGRFVWPRYERGPRDVRYEHRAYAKDGRELPVKVVEE